MRVYYYGHNSVNINAIGLGVTQLKSLYSPLSGGTNESNIWALLRKLYSKDAEKKKKKKKQAAEYH